MELPNWISRNNLTFLNRSELDEIFGIMLTIPSTP